jgi:hypothetical protein
MNAAGGAEFAEVLEGTYEVWLFDPTPLNMRDLNPAGKPYILFFIVFPSVNHHLKQTTLCP